jgi:hypothetical protein
MRTHWLYGKRGNGIAEDRIAFEYGGFEIPFIRASS